MLGKRQARKTLGALCLEVECVGGMKMVMRWLFNKCLYCVLACALTLNFGPVMAEIKTSPMVCSMSKQGANYHIQCDVTRDRITVKSVVLNDGECQTMQEHYESHPDELWRFKASTGLSEKMFEFRKTYDAGDKFTIFIKMPCGLRTYFIDTDQGSWGWHASGI